MKNGQTVVLLHGWGKWLSVQAHYQETIKEFQKKGYTVCIPDMPGFGASPAPIHPLVLYDYAEFIDNYIKKNNITSPILIGHSFGGRVIIKYVSSFQSNVSAIILSGTPGYSPVKKIKWLILVLMSKIGKIVFTIPGLRNVSDKVRGWFYYIVGARDYYRAQDSMRQTFKNIVGEKLESMMKRIQIPTLMIWGESDSIVPVCIARKMNKVICDSKLFVISHVGHNVLIDQPKTFVQEVDAFIQSI